MSKRQVPELSLLSYVNGSPEVRSKFVSDLFEGLKEYGFIILVDHTVDALKVSKAYDLVHQFFQLPLETKNLYGGVPGGQRGYTPFKKEHAKDSTHPDLKEFWHVGRELASDSPYKGRYPENLWPKEVQDFKEVFLELYDSMDQTAVLLLEAIGVALGVEKNYFKEMINDGNTVLRTIHYPPTVGEDTENSVRAGAHEDINLITMLVGATDGGLELLDRDGKWLSVKTEPGQIVVDTGDMMSRLTNDILPSTTHRVVNPKESNSTRYSMPFFVHPHDDAMISCLDSCVGEGKKYEDITASKFLIQRLEEIGLY
ncbi:MAG: isopenicillin N synthase-like dioxygenase [Bacteriovoracaceae bacterium]|jgi:isopenicillin N synthase-like dioxygenase